MMMAMMLVLMEIMMMIVIMMMLMGVMIIHFLLRATIVALRFTQTANCIHHSFRDDSQ